MSFLVRVTPQGLSLQSHSEVSRTGHESLRRDPLAWMTVGPVRCGSFRLNRLGCLCSRSGCGRHRRTHVDGHPTGEASSGRVRTSGAVVTDTASSALDRRVEVDASRPAKRACADRSSAQSRAARSPVRCFPCRTCGLRGIRPGSRSRLPIWAVEVVPLPRRNDAMTRP